MHLFLNLRTCYTRWPPTTRIVNFRPLLFESASHSVNFPLAHTVIAILTFHSSVTFTSIYTLRTQNYDHISCSISRFLIFVTASRPALRHTQPPIQWIPGVKRPGRDADHSPLPSEEVKRAELYLQSPNTSSRRDA
jgi:hypothetical protein